MDFSSNNAKALCGAFENSGLETIQLPARLSFIAYRTFRGCKNLRSVVLPSALKVISSDCFRESGIESIQIPNNVMTIEVRAFYKCENLREVTLSSALREI